MSPSVPHPILHIKSVKPSGAHRVLILDDEPAILFAYRKIIESEGIHVDSSTTLTEALSYLESHRYLAVVADVRLSGSENQDGLEFIKIVRNSHPATRVILATGYGSSDVQNSAKALGAEHYFIKPVQPTSIVEALKGFIFMTPDATS